MHEEKKNLLSELPPKTVFSLGLAFGFLALCTIGFFILLSSFFSSDGGANAFAKANAPERAAQAQPGPTAQVAQISLSKDDWYKGEKGAKIAIVEYSDTECPFCRRFHNTMNQVIDEYGDKVKWVYRHFPLTSIHPNAAKEAEATECAGELGGNKGFWAFTDKLFEITPSNNKLDLDELPKIAQQVGLNKTKFESCLESGKYAQKVKDQADQAVAAGARGTPFSVLVAGDERIVINGAQPYEQVKAAIESVLR